MKALITGATKGIGFAIAKAFASRHMDLALCSRNIADLEATKTKLNKINPDIDIFIQAVDLADKDAVYTFSEDVRRWGEIDVLVNNAGIYIPGEVHLEADHVLENLFKINVMAPYYLTKTIVKGMKARQKGFVFNISSVAGLQAYPNGGSYSITKFALSGFSKALREELKAFNIKVCTVYPGATWSNSWDGMKDTLPMDRLMEAKDIAKAISLQLDLSPQAVLEDIILRPQLGDL